MKPYKASYDLCTYCGVLQLDQAQPIQHARHCPEDHEHVETGTAWFLSRPNAEAKDPYGPYRTKQEAVTWLRLLTFRGRRGTKR